MSALREGLVVRLDRKVCHVEVDGEVLPCALRGRLFQDEHEETRPVAVGDRVRVRVDGAQGAIEEILPRSSQIVRARERGRVQILAANVDLVVVVATLREPPPRPGLVDRLLVEAESSHVAAAVVLNKLDLVTAGEARDFLAPYAEMGYATFLVSARERVGLEGLQELMTGRIAFLLGHSGVGKSSLLNALDPALELRVGPVDARHAKGRHTTTHSSLLHLGFGAHVVDAPGLREFGLHGIVPEDLGAYFRDLVPYHNRCRYARCTHAHEPGCAVQEAVEAGAIRRERYQSYRKLLDELSGGGQRMPRHSSY